MIALTLDMIKANSRIETDEEDELLEQLGDTAEQMVEQILRRTWFELEADYTYYPAPVVRAALMLVDHLYNNRGATNGVTVQAVPFGVTALLKPYVLLK